MRQFPCFPPQRPVDSLLATKTTPSPWIICLLAICMMPGSSIAQEAQAQEPSPKVPAQKVPIEPLQLEDNQPVTQQALSEEEADRREALTLFGTARKKEQEEQEAEAIRLYQRAHRLDPTSTVILDRVVPLIFKQKRMEEGIRYAVRGAQLKISNPALAQQLALHLTERGNIAVALDLYNKLLESEKDEEKKTPQHVVRVMERGRLSFILGKYADAADSFAQVLEAIEKAQEYGLNAQARGVLLGDASRTYNLFAEAFLKAERFEEAGEAFDSAYSVDRDKGALSYNQARLLLAQKKPAEALAELQKYFDRKNRSQSVGPYQLLREILKSTEKENDLLPRLQALAEEDNTNPHLALYLADLQREHSKWDEAERLYKVCLEELPDNADNRASRGEAQKGLVATYHQMKQFGSMLDVLADVVERDGDLDAVGAQVQPLTKDKDALSGILEAARQRARKDDLSYPGRMAAALLAQEAKMPEAGEMYELALASRPESAGEVLLMWGIGLLFSEQSEQAAKVFQRAIDEKVLDEKNPAFHYYLASALELSGKTEAALEAARHAASLNEDNPRLAARAPWVLYHAKRYDEARKEYQALLDKVKDLPTPEAQAARREARLILSSIDVIRHDLPSAEEWVEQVLDEFPDDTTANNDLGYLWADQGKHLRRALKMVEKAVAAEPANKAFLDSLGWVHHRLGNHAEALKYLEKAAAGEDPDAVILDHLGDAQLAAGEVEKARESWRKAAEKFDAKHDAAKLQATREKLEKHKS